MPTVRLPSEEVMMWMPWSNHQSFQPVLESLSPLDFTYMKLEEFLHHLYIKTDTIAPV